MEHTRTHPHPKRRDVRAIIDPVLLVSFVLTALTGLMMFFHLRVSGMGWLHRWAGNLFVLAAFAHLFPNARGLWRQLKTPLGVALAFLTLAALAFGTWNVVRSLPAQAPPSATASQGR